MRDVYRSHIHTEHNYCLLNYTIYTKKTYLSFYLHCGRLETVGYLLECIKWEVVICLQCEIITICSKTTTTRMVSNNYNFFSLEKQYITCLTPIYIYKRAIKQFQQKKKLKFYARLLRLYII